MELAKRQWLELVNSAWDQNDEYDLQIYWEVEPNVNLELLQGKEYADHRLVWISSVETW